MSMGPRSVSVVIPAYKASRTIGRAIETVLGQTHAAAEILVVDDGSPDDLAMAIAQYGGAVTLVRQANQGAAAARNVGIERARGELVAFLDADDYWAPEKLARHVELYERDPELGLTCSRYYSLTPGEASVRLSAFSLRMDERHILQGAGAFQATLCVWTGTVVVPRRLLADERFVSGFEPAEDRHLWMRLICRAPMYCLSEPLATAVLEPGSLSRTNANRDYGNMLRVVETYRDLIGSRDVRRQQISIRARWAGRLLSEGKATEAIRPAVGRLLYDPLTLRGWWTLIKAGTLSLMERAGFKASVDELCDSPCSSRQATTCCASKRHE